MIDSPSQRRVAVIMAGGSGERFWPLSRTQRPKQLLRLTDPNRNMLEEAVDRLAPVIDPAHIIVVTGRHLQEAIQAAEIGIPAENVLAEPCKRDTAGCLCYAAAALMERYGDPARITVAVVTADHRIGDSAVFQNTVAASLAVAEQENALVTHGIPPTRPETGYGYIQAGSEAVVEDGVTFRRVSAFHEKPEFEKARTYLDDGGYFWNSGMFFWRLDVFLDELRGARPGMAETVEQLATALGKRDAAGAEAEFESLESISIDYALMEKAGTVLLAEAPYAWDDVGSWLSFERTNTADADGNVTVGEPVLVDTRNCVVYNEPGADAMAVGVIGMDEVVVVVSQDGVLVSRKSETQRVRDVVRALKERGSDQI